jgi:predicted nucleic acid-binding Zn ribbon protein
MREPFVHEAVLRMDADADTRAPGASVTVELCGHWEHEPPCPVAAHHTRAEEVGDEVRLRVLFATEAGREGEVRARIAAALAQGGFRTTRWTLLGDSPGTVAEDEADHARRLATG